MIVYSRSCYSKKLYYQLWLLDQKLFQIEHKTIYKTGQIIYPIKGRFNGLYFEIDEYKGYLTGFYNVIYNNMSDKRIGACSNMNYTKFIESLKTQLSLMYDPLDTNLTVMSISYWIIIDIDVQDLFYSHLIIHKLKYYNSNKIPKKKKGFIKFDYDDYSIEISICKHEKKKMKITLILKNIKRFKNLGKINVTELYDRNTLKRLFQFYFKKFDEILIVNRISANNVSNQKDRDLLRSFTSYGHWEALDKHTRARQKKVFYRLIDKYKLDAMNKVIRQLLLWEHEKFINH
ncbi:hypothetical protein [Winogradskyella forsetii]|uniref:hypothetical protein n=1 Tax=Winogradskyella forsetii TaxID=2686077 RepID=UPI0015B9C82D|nr:hypothetical protein [Winogradskyella forsetii]